METRARFAFQTPARSLVKDVLGDSLGVLPGVTTPQDMIDTGLEVVNVLNGLATHLGLEVEDVRMCIRDPLMGDPTGERIYTEDERRQLAMHTRIEYVPEGHVVVFPDGSKMSAFPSDDSVGLCHDEDCSLCVKAAYAFNPDAHYRMAVETLRRESLPLLPPMPQPVEVLRRAKTDYSHPEPHSYAWKVFHDMLGSDRDVYPPDGAHVE